MRAAPLMRIGRDGRFGLRLAQPGTGRRDPALDYRPLAEERQRFDEAEERRLFYVAMTRARERLVLSGAARLDAWPVNGGSGPIGWIGPAFVPEIAARAGALDEPSASVSSTGVAVRFVRPGSDVDGLSAGIERLEGPGLGVAGADATPDAAA